VYAANKNRADNNQRSTGSQPNATAAMMGPTTGPAPAIEEK